MQYLLLLTLFACTITHYTDPEQAKFTYYRCEKKHEVLVKHSDDYQSIALRYNQGEQIMLYYFVTEEGVGYHAENLLWLTKGRKAVLIKKAQDGTEEYLLKKCKAEKPQLRA